MNEYLRHLCDVVDLKNITGTCVAENIRDGGLAYAVSREVFQKIEAQVQPGFRVTVLVRKGISLFVLGGHPFIRVVRVKDPELDFVLMHNLINHQVPLPDLKIAKSAQIHPLAVLGCEGTRYVKHGGRLVLMKHMGSVTIGEDVVVGPLSVIARGTIQDTVIKSQVKIEYRISIGHNSVIGSRTIFLAGATVAGSCRIGEDCWIGIGSQIREQVRICDNVLVGAGSIVTKDLNEPGKYYGTPARRRGDWDGKW